MFTCPSSLLQTMSFLKAKHKFKSPPWIHNSAQANLAERCLCHYLRRSTLLSSTGTICIDQTRSSMTWPAMACWAPMSRPCVTPAGPGDAGLLMYVDSGHGTRRDCKISSGLVETVKTAASKALWLLSSLPVWTESLRLFSLLENS